MTQPIQTVFAACVAAVFSLSGTTATALSCMRPDPVATFLQAAASTESYVVLYGSFQFDGSQMPSFDGRTEPGDLPPVPAHFDGAALTTGGFTLPYETDLWLQPICAGPWCGAMQPADNVLAFVRNRDDGTYELELGPCPFWAFFDPTREDRSNMTACMNDDPACRPSERIGR